LHGFYDVWKQHQIDNGNINFSKLFRYDIWRKCWYSYLDLLKIDEKAINGFRCDKCGDEPELVVCDATSLGFQKKYSVVAFQTKIDLAKKVFPRAS